jgi:hypothetical protein
MTPVRFVKSALSEFIRGEKSVFRFWAKEKPLRFLSAAELFEAVPLLSDVNA